MIIVIVVWSVNEKINNVVVVVISEMSLLLLLFQFLKCAIFSIVTTINATASTKM